MQSLFTTGNACFDDIRRFPTEAGVALIEGEVEKSTVAISPFAPTVTSKSMPSPPCAT
jgi:hypothetical protein